MKPATVSIIIPCRNEEHSIGRCLDSILASNYPKDSLEVLVVDGASEDGTREVVNAYAAKHPCIRLVENPSKTTPAAMNRGIASSTGSVILINSAHSAYPPNFISKSLEWLERTGAEVVGGPIMTSPGTDNRIARSIALAVAHPFGVGNSRFRTSFANGYVDTVPFGAYRRAVFDRVGLFDERLERNQDNELCSRIIQSGGKIFMTQDLVACYYSRPTITSLVKQGFGNGMWSVLTIRITPAAFRLRHFTPFVFVGALGALALGMAAVPWCRPLLLALLCVYVMAAVLASLDIALRSGIKDALILPPIFFALHTAYGAGTWCGLFRLAGSQWGRAGTSECGIEHIGSSGEELALPGPGRKVSLNDSPASNPSVLYRPERAGSERMD